MPDRTLTDVLPIQVVVANASPSAWRDGLVVARHRDRLTVALLDGQLVAMSTLAAPDPGEPVAVHPAAGIVAVGGAWVSARALGEDG